LPNKTHIDSPVGGEDRNQVIKEGGPKIDTDRTMSHLDIGHMFDLFDFANASKLTGSKFVFLKNEAAMLEMALCSYAMTKVMRKGFTAVTTPDIAR
jgi:seryl-tRNA synthetase